MIITVAAIIQNQLRVNQTEQLILRGMNQINQSIPIDETLKHFNLGCGIIIDYHYPPSLESIIGACFIIGLIIVIKKWKITNDKENEENNASTRNKGIEK